MDPEESAGVQLNTKMYLAHRERVLHKGRAAVRHATGARRVGRCAHGALEERNDRADEPNVRVAPQQRGGGAEG